MELASVVPDVGARQRPCAGQATRTSERLLTDPARGAGSIAANGGQVPSLYIWGLLKVPQLNARPYFKYLEVNLAVDQNRLYRCLVDPPSRCVGAPDQQLLATFGIAHVRQ